jgi:adenine-specific DNA-methyltransferase
VRYIGSKARLLGFIYDTITSTYGPIDGAVVADLFAGTCCVAAMLKRQGACVITNDYLHFSYALQVAKVKLNAEPACSISYHDALTQLNSLVGIEGFFFREYTLDGSTSGGFRRNYFSAYNAKKIDAICTKLKEWESNNKISADMYYLLAASLVDSITKVSNTTGTYGAFLKIDDPRKYREIQLLPFKFFDNQKENTSYCLDISDVIDGLQGDILYLDPPYNTRQYPPYYHILETAVLYDSPPIYGITGRRPYQEKLSPFCIKDKAMPAMLDIIKRAHFSNIYISYSTDGIIDYKELCEQLSAYGNVQCFFKPYRRYKSNDGGDGGKRLKEILIHVRKR